MARWAARRKSICSRCLSGASDVPVARPSGRLCFSSHRRGRLCFTQVAVADEDEYLCATSTTWSQAVQRWADTWPDVSVD